MAYINDPEKRKELTDYVDNQINQAGIESDIKHMELLVKDLTLARSAAAAPTDHEQWELNVDGLYQNTVTGKTQPAAPAPTGPHPNSTDSVAGATAKLQTLMDEYKRSVACRSEAEYAYVQKKPIVPLMLQQDYKPDGDGKLSASTLTRIFGTSSR
jgi:hypothetical protein